MDDSIKVEESRRGSSGRSAMSVVFFRPRACWIPSCVFVATDIVIDSFAAFATSVEVSTLTGLCSHPSACFRFLFLLRTTWFETVAACSFTIATAIVKPMLSSATLNQKSGPVASSTVWLYILYDLVIYLWGRMQPRPRSVTGGPRSSARRHMLQSMSTSITSGQFSESHKCFEKL